MPEYLTVGFSRRRQVLINGENRGETNELLVLEGGTYEITLAGSPDFTPERQKIDLRNTSALEPREITFEES